ncbi:MAG: hypothetical protein JWM36_1229 [Hyphomicrobiales bacterium]|nr:hypothetical protein [Hyphomicrobiales bacterium]
MAQEKGKSGGNRTEHGPTPNRDRRREPPVIEGEAIRNDDDAVSPADLPGENEALRTHAPEAQESSAQEPIADAAPVQGQPETPAEPTVAEPGSFAEARERNRRGAPYDTTRPAPAPDRRALLPTLASLAALLLAGTSLYVAWTAEQGGVSNESFAALSQRLDRTDGRLGTLEARPAALMPDLGPLAARIGAVETKAASAQADAGRALERAASPAPAPQAPRVDLAPLERRLQALEARQQPTFDAGPLEQRLSSIEAAITPLQAVLNAPKSEVRATQAPSVVETPPGDAAAVAVVAESLRQKLERGAPFTIEIAALEKLHADAAQLGPLKGMAEKGAPTAGALADAFEPLAAATLRAGRSEPSGDFLDRLARNAASLVRVRPVGEATGENTAALVSRIEASLGRGDVQGAVTLWERLPGDAKAPSRDWADRARNRAQADAAARQILDQAIERLGRTK